MRASPTCRGTRLEPLIHLRGPTSWARSCHFQPRACRHRRKHCHGIHPAIRASKTVPPELYLKGADRSMSGVGMMIRQQGTLLRGITTHQYGRRRGTVLRCEAWPRPTNRGGCGRRRHDYGSAYRCGPLARLGRFLPRSWVAGPVQRVGAQSLSPLWVKYGSRFRA